MKIERVTWSHRNDFNAMMVCEHCGHTQEDKGLYNDAFYHERVIPKRHHCGACGKNSFGEAPVESPSQARPATRSARVDRSESEGSQ